MGGALCAIVPTAFSVAAQVSGGQSAPAVATTATFGYAGLLLGPFVIGFMADSLSLRVGLSLAVVLSAVIVTCARRLPDVAVPVAHRA